MGVSYNGMKLVWLKQHATNKTQVDWISPPEGDVGSFSGGQAVSVPARVRVINGPAATFSIANGSVPPGLAIDPNTGALYGNVNNTSGAYFYTIRATSNGEFADRNFSSNVATNLPPNWITNAGSIGSQFDNTQANVALLAIDPEGAKVSYSVLTGSLPPGTRLDASSGRITGLLKPTGTSDTTSFFTVRASDGSLTADQAFNFTTKYNAPPLWTTPDSSAGPLISAVEGSTISTQVHATDSTMGQSVTYSLAVGSSLPSGLTLDANTGTISGTLPAVQQNTQAYFTVVASDGFKAVGRSFLISVIKNLPPNWVTSGTIIAGFENSPATATLSAVDPNGDTVFYSVDSSTPLPGTLVLDGNTGVISGTLPSVASNTDYTVMFIASDGKLIQTRNLKITTRVDAAPVWNTGTTLSNGLGGKPYSFQLSATDGTGAGRPITYSNTSPLPPSLNLTSGGLVTGNLDWVNVDTFFSFDVVANSGVLSNARTFSMTVKEDIPPVWVTTPGLIANAQSLYHISAQLSASDPNGETVTFTTNNALLPPGVGLSSSGLISGTLPAVANTTQYDFTVSISDGVNPSVDELFSIIVNPNNPPVWNTNAGVIGGGFETTPFSFFLSATDPEGKPISYYTTDTMPTGLTLVGSTGQVYGTLPHVEQDATLTFDVYADDGTPGNVSRVARQFQVQVKFNSPPVFQSPANLGHGIESLPYSYQLQATGVGNGPMVYTINSGVLPTGLSMSHSGLISGTMPAVAADTPYSFTVFAFNGIKGSSQTFNLTVQKNLAPVWNSNSGSLGTFYGGNRFSVGVSATDPNGQNVTYALVSPSDPLPTGLGFSGGTFTGSLPIVQNATTYNFTVRASDGVLSSDLPVSISSYADAAPSWVTGSGNLLTVYKNKTVSVTVAASDPENEHITYSLVNNTVLPSTLSLNPNTGAITGIAPNDSVETVYPFTVRAADATQFVDRDFSITVQNDQPPVWNTPMGSLGTILSGYSGGFTVVATDPEGQTITYSLDAGSNLPPGMFLSGNQITSGAGTVPASYTDATYNFSITATDGQNPISRSFSITILKNQDPTWITAGGSLGTALEAQHVSVTLQATDPEGKPLTYAVTSGSLPSGLSLTGATGVISGTTGSVSSDTTSNFDITVSDSVRTATESFTYTVQFSSPPQWTTPAGSLGSQLEQTAFTATVNAVANGHRITYAVSNATLLPDNLHLDSNTGVISGTLTAVQADATQNFTIAATDQVTSKVAYRTFAITTIHNLPPNWNTPSGNLLTDLAGTAVNITLSATDPNGTGLVYSLVSGTMPNTVVLDANTGALTGSLPFVSQDTTYDFTIGAFDGAFRVDQEFTLVSEFDTPPVWNTNAVLPNVYQSAPYSQHLVATDPQHKTVTYTENGANIPGTLHLLSNGYLFGVAPVEASNTAITFAVDAFDGTMTATQTFTLNVIYNTPPVWNTNAGALGSVIGGKPFSFQLSATDPEGDAVTYTLANSTTLPLGLTLSSSGLISGTTASVANTATTSFSVRASDGEGTTTDRAFSITVQSVFDAQSASVVYLNHFDNAATTTDNYGIAMSLSGGAAISNAATVFSSNNALAMPSTTAVATTGLVPASNWNGGSGDYTAELWFYVTAYPNATDFYNHILIKNDNSGNTIFGARLRNDSSALQGLMYGFAGGQTATQALSQSSAVSLNTWHHLAFVMTGSTGLLYFDGVQFANLAMTRVGSSTGLQLTGNGSGQKGLVGYVDEVRVSNYARYTSNFTKPVAPFPDPPIMTASPAVKSYSAFEGNAISISGFAATDPYSSGLNYVVATGSLPSTVILNSISGAMTGSFPTYNAVSSTYNFSISAKDGENNLSNSVAFTVISNNAAPVWTSTGSLGYTISNNTVNLQLLATDPLGKAITYSVVSGSLPASTTLDANTGIISGTPMVAADTTYSFTVKAQNTAGKSANTNLSYGVYASADPLYSQTALLMHADTGFNDQTGHFTPTNGGAMAISNASQVSAAFGNSIATANSASSYVSVPLGASYNINTSDFTIEGWFNQTSIPGWGGTYTQYLFTYGNTSGTSFVMFYGSADTNTPKYLVARVSDANGIHDTNAGTPIYGVGGGGQNIPAGIPFNTWNHIAVSKVGSTFYTFFNGTLINEAVLPAINTASNYNLYVGCSPLSSGQLPFFGFIDEVRVTVGTARYTANFTPPTAPFPNIQDATPVWSSANTVVALDSNSAASYQLTATSTGGNAITYALTSGSFPPGVSLNSNGLVTGTTNAVIGNSISYTANVAATWNGSFTAYKNLTYTVLAMDPYWQDVVTMVHAEDVPNSTVLADSAGKQTFTLTSGGSVSTANQKFGNSAIYLPGANSSTNIIQTAANPAGVYFGANDFTVEAWVYPTTLLSTNIGGQWRGCIAALKGPGGATGADWVWSLEMIGNSATNITSIAFEAYLNVNTPISQSTATVSGNMPMNQWHHVAVSRTNGVLSFWLNGVQYTDVGSPKLGSQTLQAFSTARLTIGGLLYPNLSGNFKGYIDELRITNGKGRYTANFTPPVLPFANTQDPSLIWSTANTSLYLDGGTQPNLVLSASTAVGNSTGITYSLVSGSLPGTISLNSNGVMTGATDVVLQGGDAVVHNATVTAINGAYSANTSLGYITQAPDPYFHNVGALLHADGVYTDASGNLTFTAAGGAGTSTIAKYGSGSFSFPGVHGAWVQSGALPAKYNLGTTNWTVEMWANVVSFPQYVGYGSQNNYTGILMEYGYLASTSAPNQYNSLSLSVSSDAANATTSVKTMGWQARNNDTSGTVTGQVSVGLSNVSTNQWNHYVFQRTGNFIQMYLNGQLLANSAFTSAITYSASYLITLGSLIVNAGGGNTGLYYYPLNGYIDDFRMTLGQARYTGNSFTLPAYPYPNTQDPTPVWSTANTNLTLDSATAPNLVLSAAPVAGANNVIYSVTSGSLPGTMVLNTNGVITGYTVSVSAGNSVSYSAVISANNNGYTANTTVNYTVQGPDPFFSNTSLLIHAEDTANGTTLTDSTGNMTFTLNSGGSVSTANKKFGSSALYLPGTTTATNVIQSQANPAAVNFGTNPFTLEAWIYPTSLTSGRAAILSLKNPSSGATTSDLAFYWYLSGSNTQANAMVLEFDSQALSVSANAAITMSAWNHVAVTRSGATVNFFLNGTLLTSINTAPPTSGTSIPLPSGATLQIGGLTYSGVSSNFGGYMDEVRITNGVARYTSTFTPPALPFPSVKLQQPVFAAASPTAVRAYSNAQVWTQLSATPAGSYTLTNGTIPAGLTLYSNGVLTGVTNAVVNTTVSNFTVTAATSPDLTNTSTVSYTVDPIDPYAANTIVQLRAAKGFIDMTGNFIIANGSSTTITTPTLASALSNDTNKTFNFAGAYGNLNSYIHTGNLPSGMALGTRNYTLEMWANISMLSDAQESAAGAANLFTLGVPNTAPNSGIGLEVGLYSNVGANTATSFIWRGYTGSTIINQFTNGFSPFTCNYWRHYAFVKNGNQYTFYLDGVAIATQTISTTSYQYQSSLQWYFGLVTFPAAQATYCAPFNGQMDDIRITLDVARYTSNFTPPGALGR